MHWLFVFAGMISFASEANYLPPDAQVTAPRSCAEVDHRHQLHRPRAQGDTSYCFAYAAAELIEQRTGQWVSALDLAAGFYFETPESLLGLDGELARHLNRHPDLLAGISRRRLGPDVSIQGRHPFLHRLEGGFEAPTLLLANTWGLCSEERLPSDNGFAAHAQIVRVFQRRAWRGQGRAGLEVEGVVSRFRGPKADIFNTLWLRHANSACATKTPPPVELMPVEYQIAENVREFYARRSSGEINSKDQERVLRVLDFAMDHGRAVSLSFDLNTLLAENPRDDGDHAAAVVGRRWRQGVCQYLVRDSSGYECRELRKPIRARCHGSEYWLTERELRRSLYGSVYLR